MKNHYRKAAVYSMVLSSMLLFAACSSSEKPVSTTTPATPTATPTASVTPVTSAAPTTSPVASSVPSPAASTSSPGPAASNDQVTKQLKDMFALAKSGMVSGIEFAAKTGLIDDVEKKWGKADKEESAGSGIYATYTKKNAVIGFNKGSQIIDIRSNDPKLHTLTLSQIEQALGKPTDTKLNGDDTIYIYQASDIFQLKFIIPKSTGKVDHISVFDTKDSVNNMAG